LLDYQNNYLGRSNYQASC